LRGDSKHYWCTVYTVGGGPISYRAPIEPSSNWTEVTIPFSSLTPYRRGTRVPDAPPFNPSQVRTMGILIADEQAGPFRLEVSWIRRHEPS